MSILLIIISFLLVPVLIICFLAILEEKRKKQIKKDLKKAIGQISQRESTPGGWNSFFPSQSNPLLGAAFRKIRAEFHWLFSRSNSALWIGVF